MELQTQHLRRSCRILSLGILILAPVVTVLRPEICEPSHPSLWSLGMVWLVAGGTFLCGRTPWGLRHPGALLGALLGVTTITGTLAPLGFPEPERPLTILFPMVTAALLPAYPWVAGVIAAEVIVLLGAIQIWADPVPPGFGPPAMAVAFVAGVIGRDVVQTQQRIYASLRNARDEAIEALRVRSELVANVSHEIRTPLTAILGLSEDLLPRASGPDRSDVQRVHSNAEHLLHIVDDLLDLAKLERARVTVQRSRCATWPLLLGPVDLFEARAREKALRIEIDPQSRLPQEIETDATRVRQIVMNLLSNAIKFTEQGAITIAAQVGRSEAGEPELEVSVEDTGMGIHADDLARLFAPFEQVESSARRAIGGTGLGLAISRRLARLLGGDLVAVSEPGRGSCFRLTLDPGALADGPLVAPPSASPARAPSRASVPRLSGRVLLAEDSPDNQRLLARLIERTGAELERADDGEAAYQRVKEAASREALFDLVLMDMHMPVCDGYQATRRLRSEGFTLPIVALTAQALPEQRESCLRAGCTDFASKPIPACDLYDLLARFLPKSPDPP